MDMPKVKASSWGKSIQATCSDPTGHGCAAQARGPRLRVRKLLERLELRRRHWPPQVGIGIGIASHLEGGESVSLS